MPREEIYDRVQRGGAATTSIDATGINGRSVKNSEKNQLRTSAGKNVS
jgi:hypothetical protein